MRNQMSLDLPVAESEPKPWVVRVWRYGSSNDEPFVTREEAIEHMDSLEDAECWVEGVFCPDGTQDKTVTKWWSRWWSR